MFQSIHEKAAAQGLRIVRNPDMQRSEREIQGTDGQVLFSGDTLQCDAWLEGRKAGVEAAAHVVGRLKERAAAGTMSADDQDVFLGALDHVEDGVRAILGK